MAFDEGLAERVREILSERFEFQEKKMFGGLCFMLFEHMCCGIINDSLMCRVGPDEYEQCLKQKHVSEMDFTGKPMKGMVYVSAEGVAEDADLRHWLAVCWNFVMLLPPKVKK